MTALFTIKWQKLNKKEEKLHTNITLSQAIYNIFTVLENYPSVPSSGSSHLKPPTIVSLIGAISVVVWPWWCLSLCSLSFTPGYCTSDSGNSRVLSSITGYSWLSGLITCLVLLSRLSIAALGIGWTTPEKIQFQ